MHERLPTFGICTDRVDSYISHCPGECRNAAFALTRNFSCFKPGYCCFIAAINASSVDAAFLADSKSPRYRRMKSNVPGESGRVGSALPTCQRKRENGLVDLQCARDVLPGICTTAVTSPKKSTHFRFSAKPHQ